MSKIPGISLAALQAIQDENVRTVLSELTTGWMIRNAGTALPEDGAFVTRRELTSVLGADEVQGARGVWPQVTDVFSIVSNVAADVAASPDFQDLVGRVGVIRVDLDATGSRVDTEITDRTNADTAIRTEITTQVSGLVNGPIAALQQTQGTIATDVSALTQSVTALQSTVGSNTSALQIEAQARVDADNSLFAKYSVKIDQNGHVSGFGLMSEANNSTPTSSFIVRADRFAVSNDTQAGGASVVVPFVVENDLVYIDQALITKLSAGVLDVQKLSGTSKSFTAVGSHQFMVPDGFTTVKVTTRAGGGGGGGAASRSPSWGGGGGGQGGTSIHTFTDVAPGSIIDIVIGAGGQGGFTPEGSTLGGAGQAGQSTSVTLSGVTFSSNGGQGGGAASPGSPGTPGSGGAGGAGAGAGLAGANGSAGALNNGGLGGGAGAGAGGKGSNGSAGPYYAPSGAPGSCLIEAYNPNGVVLRQEWSNLIGNLSSRFPQYTWP